jgi:xylulokinase
MAAALGLGLTTGDVALSLGTSGVVYAASPTPTADPSGAVAGFADATGGYLPLVCTLNATKVTDTVAGWLGMDHETFAAAALDAPAGAHGVRLTPYFDGERTPNLPDATGTFEGLRNDTTSADLARAAHEGVLRGLLFGREALAAAGAAVDGRVHLIGGGARSPAYRQILADLIGASIRVPDADETVATGGAVQAAAMLGRSFANTATAWDLGAGIDIGPS